MQTNTSTVKLTTVIGVVRRPVEVIYSVFVTLVTELHQRSDVTFKDIIGTSM